MGHRKAIDAGFATLEKEGLLKLTVNASDTEATVTSISGMKLSVKQVDAERKLFKAEMEFPGDLPPADEGPPGGSGGQGGSDGKGEGGGEGPAKGAGGEGPPTGGGKPQQTLKQCLFNGQVLFVASNVANIAGAFKGKWEDYLGTPDAPVYTRWV